MKTALLVALLFLFLGACGHSPKKVQAKKRATTLTITVTSGAPPPVNGACAGGTNGTFYSCTMTGTGGTPPYDWSIIEGSLPQGLTGTVSTNIATNDTFTISGIPSVSFPPSAPGLFNPPVAQ